MKGSSKWGEQAGATALVCGGGGFIGNHAVTYLKKLGFRVRVADIKRPEFSESLADEFSLVDLRSPSATETLFSDCQYDLVLQLAANMGGADFIFTGAQDFEIMNDSALININVSNAAVRHPPGCLFYSSSACVYPEHNQMDPDNPNCAESSAYPAAPDSEYGWEKIFSERLYLAAARNHGLNARIARFHNIFGPEGTWRGGREKAPAAICRKVASAEDGGNIEIYGDGLQTRSFLYIDECLNGIRLLCENDINEPINIGSDEMVTIRQMAEIVIGLSGKSLAIKSIDGPLGVRGRNSDNRLIHQRTSWRPSQALHIGLASTYSWIADQVVAAASSNLISGEGGA
ncbi:NAD-dependent epimerase/dehydratase family protein [Desulfosediminicola sp.]|uniref:NAD-dependent epimerase/dehydratase family protein n=1 Tax=Desulfosediminicola sp. TaxID=2886825 RepID=UPI003AF2C69D